MATIAIDFDGTLCDPNSKKPGMRMGLPIEGAIEAMQAMKKKGHQLIIFTVRGDRPKHVMDWLNYYNIPFDDVTNIKQPVDLYIDDRAVTFTDWGSLKSLWE